MTFDDYIGYLGIITINIQYSATSNRTLEEVKNIVIDRVNRISWNAKRYRVKASYMKTLWWN